MASSPGTYNSNIKTEGRLVDKWVSSTGSSRTFKENVDNPFEYNQNYSGNTLDENISYVEKHPHEYYINHRNDIIGHLGFDYRGNILKRSLSSAMFLEKKRKGLLGELEKILVYLVDSIKHIKKSYNWALEKDYRDFN